MDTNDLIFTLNNQCIGLVDTIDQLFDVEVVKGDLKKQANRLMKQCEKENNILFKDNPPAVEVLDKMNGLQHKVESLHPSEKIALDNFINEIISMRK